eukprot:CAMPEP_0170635560 /NCGR_PEP_ID=MMETSP0224-20130122/37285_1 /TAXON_ID=285029 /ORGANISM="Togula jolla, Strain CCCM 725" /LENGTH=39 /DNA_ID= /DNA_START= /DNA_END= /DNA_ORIENTATION=
MPDEAPVMSTTFGGGAFPRQILRNTEIDSTTETVQQPMT